MADPLDPVPVGDAPRTAPATRHGIAAWIRAGVAATPVYYACPKDELATRGLV